MAQDLYRRLGDVQLFFHCRHDVPLWVRTGLIRRGAIVSTHQGPGEYRDLNLFRHTGAELSHDYFFIRDVDSRPSDREVNAMQEFIESKQAIHVMRDHPFHFAPIMGGMWGGRSAAFRPPRDSMTYRILWWLKGQKVPKNRYGFNQKFLAENVWPDAQIWGVVQHDSFHRDRYEGAVPFPDGDETSGAFVGEVFNDLHQPDEEHRAWRKKALDPQSAVCHTCGAVSDIEEPQTCKCHES